MAFRMTRRISRAEVHDIQRVLAREGTHRMISLVPVDDDDSGDYRLTTELIEPRIEIR